MPRRTSVRHVKHDDDACTALCGRSGCLQWADQLRVHGRKRLWNVYGVPRGFTDGTAMLGRHDKVI